MDLELLNCVASKGQSITFLWDHHLITWQTFGQQENWDLGISGWFSGLAPAFGPGLILESRDRVPHQAPCTEPPSPSACVSASLSLKRFFKSFLKITAWGHLGGSVVERLLLAQGMIPVWGLSPALGSL